MRKLLFRGVRLRHFNRTRKEVGRIVRIHITCDPTEDVADELGWSWDDGLLADGQSSADLEGELRIGGVRIDAPAGLDQHGFEMVADEIRDFTVVRVKTESGSSEVELRAVLLTSAPTAFIDEYWAVIGDGRGTLIVELSAEQGTLTPQDDDDEPEEAAEMSASDEDEEDEEPVPAVAAEMEAQRFRK